VLAPIAWRTPPRHYGPWEQFASLLTEGLVAAGHHVTLFATADSITTATLHATAHCGWSEDATIATKVAECLHIASAFERAGEFDIIHNGFDFLPLTYSDLVARRWSRRSTGSRPIGSFLSTSAMTAQARTCR
jgi:hypothetical protein